MAIIKKIGVLSLAKLQSLMMAVFGLFIGIIYAILYATMPSTLFADTDTMLVQNLGYMSIIIFPIFYAVIGFVFGSIGALIYNLFAKWIGGLEVEIGK